MTVSVRIPLLQTILVALLLITAPLPVLARGYVGIYTLEQVQRGAEIYSAQCAACHGDKLQGGPQSPLKGPVFMAKWGQGNRTVEDLYQIIKTQMPYGRPDSLPPQQYADVVALVLEKNGYVFGPQELKPDSLELIETQLKTQQFSEPQSRDTLQAEAPTFISSGAKASSTKPTQAELNGAAANSTDWLHSNHDYRGQRFVDLKQINKQNVKSLQPVAIYQAADKNAFQTNPLVYDGVIYFTTTDSTFAIDAVTAKQIWRVDRKPRAAIGWPQTRGAALKEGKIVRGTTDGYLMALDAKNGDVLWERKVGDRLKNEGGFTMAPVIWENLIFIGPAGSELGIKGWFGAFRLDNGEPVWRVNTIPDDKEPGADTWSTRDGRMVGGGSTWGPLSFDTDTGLVYVPVANPYPDYEGETRLGKNLYTNTMLVLDARTGKIKWFYQAVPHDLHDWDLSQVSPLFETKVNGKLRKLVAITGKDAMLHVLDRVTREHLYAVPVAPRENTDAAPTLEGTYTCPGVLGGVQWNGPAYHPGTNMLYVPVVDWCTKFKRAPTRSDLERERHRKKAAKEAGEEPESETKERKSYFEPIEKSKGLITALDASSGNVTWQYRSERPMLAAITATSADLLFTGELTGNFIVLDAKTGDRLYSFNTGGPIVGGVITYAINGKQFVAVTSGNATNFWQGLPASAQIIIFALPTQ